MNIKIFVQKQGLYSVELGNRPVGHLQRVLPSGRWWFVPGADRFKVGPFDAATRIEVTDIIHDHQAIGRRIVARKM
jgi:hypothetical protein